ncbi:mRNA-capping enzyme subunit alpha, putative [Plasmodium ovale]|uniref:mRNA guanylyltransferase n=2 Tax=Plasmodium ovale TaxID=36330 RepID=A0A1A8X1U4_PLAOA|nr:RNA guanylyltransferase, putative [Plasmodium ovale curtisi]SBS97688.1 RNA guanylyltransferase, putative [Plasmodium ovale curtisi]SCP06265.1 mRNA-capping enzyme subunit alpha, putative [Plasmodium ovale]
MIKDIYNPGEKIENEFLKEKIRGKINEMLKWKRKGFPGCNPVSLTKHNIKNIFTKEYLICEKTDGVRYFLFIASNTTFLIDRNYEIFKNDMHIPTIDNLKAKQQLTLLDGELVEDTIFNEKEGIVQKKIVYLIYDGLFIQRRDITNLSYLDRLTNVYNFIITPLKKYKKGNISNDNYQTGENTSNLKTIKCSTFTHETNKDENGTNVSDSSSTNRKDNKQHSGSNNTDGAPTPGRENINHDRNSYHLGIIPRKKTHSEELSSLEGDTSSEDYSSHAGDTQLEGYTTQGGDEVSPPYSEDSPFEIYLKDFYFSTQISELVKVIKKLPHTSDGIIFTPLNSPYVTGNFYQLLKWKPLNLNTVDFGIETVYDQHNLPNRFELFIAVKGVRTSYKCYLAQYGEVYKQLLELALNDKISHYIIECYYVSKNIFSICKNDNASEKMVEGGWIAQKIRYDKNIPNDIMTLNKVMQSILHNITIDSLIKEISLNRKGDKR